MSKIKFKDFHDAISNAFDPNTLALTLKRRLDMKLGTIVALNEPFNIVAFKTIEAAEMGGWDLDLLEAAYREQPRNPLLSTLYENSGLAPRGILQNQGQTVSTLPATAAGGSGFQRIVNQDIPNIDIGKLVNIADRVCFISAVGRGLGTGFLVAPDLVLTNYHVMQAFISPNVLPAGQITCTFDYRSMADGSRSGTPVTLIGGTEWLVDFSPYSPAEARNEPDGTPPTPQELDFALIRLADAVGSKPIERNAGAEAPDRGWIRIPGNPPPPNPFAPPMPILIVQHPNGSPVTLAVDHNAIINVKNSGSGSNANRTRVRYTTNTEGGSSGSPVFDQLWNLVALHHFGDPAFSHPPAYNQGVPIDAIRALLRIHGKEALIDAA